MPPSDTATQNSPLAPSVEKAYYRKCIQLKRRLNEVETANDEAKIRRVRLERAIMKMRLERAFLLDELRRRMEQNVDGSEGSGDEGMATPPPERPHRDKRRRQTQPTDDASGARDGSQQPNRESSARRGHSPSEADPHGRSFDDGADGMEDEGSISRRRSRPRGSSYRRASGSRSEPADRDANGANADDAEEDHKRDRDVRSTNREAGATGEALSAGPELVEGANGERKVAASEAAEDV